MKTKNYRRIDEILSEDNEMIKFFGIEKYMLAVQIQRNEILKSALVLSATDSYPSAIENISIVLKDILLKD